MTAKTKKTQVTDEKPLSQKQLDTAISLILKTAHDKVEAVVDGKRQERDKLVIKRREAVIKKVQGSLKTFLLASECAPDKYREGREHIPALDLDRINGLLSDASADVAMDGFPLVGCVKTSVVRIEGFSFWALPEQVEALNALKKRVEKIRLDAALGSMPSSLRTLLEDVERAFG